MTKLRAVRASGTLIALAAGLAGLAACGDNLRTGPTDETGLLAISPGGPQATTESGGTATLDVELTAAPAADVIVDVSTSNPTEGTVAPAQLTFSRATWNVPQQITVTGVDDDVVDADVVYTVRLDAGASGAADVLFTNRDDDVVGVAVTPTANLETTESGNTATFTLSLTSKPAADVVIPVSSSMPSEGTVGVTSLTFTPASWSAAQTITVRGIDDAIADGNQPYQVVLGAATSGDPLYSGFDPADVALTNLDNDTANFFVSPTTGLQTTEGGGAASFSVVLLSQPTAAVTLAIASDTPGEGTASPASVTFTSANWSAPREITVTGQDDAIADGARPYQIVLAAAVSADPAYAGRDPSDVAVLNLDNDSAGIVVTALPGLTTTEGGGAEVFTVGLLSQPTAPVTIAVSSSDATEGVATPAVLTFAPADWMVPQTVTVTGQDDALTDGPQSYVVALAPAASADALYAGIDPQDVTLTNLDDEQAGITVFPTAGLLVSEFGDTDTFELVLTSQPTADVTIPLASSTPTEGTVFPAALTFTAFNWNVPQTATVTGIQDAVADGDQQFTILTGPAASTDAAYALLDAADVSVTNIDDDSASVYVKARRRMFVTENQQQTTFRVSLTAQPSADVVCTLASSDLTEGTVAPTTLTFTPGNFGTAQVVTIIGVDDALDDGDQLFAIVLAPCTSTDPAYAGYDPRDVAVVNRDND